MTDGKDEKLIPLTVEELEEWMKANYYNFNSYALHGGNAIEGFGIEVWGGKYVWYYAERGIKTPDKYFRTEQEIVEYAYQQIRNDKWAQSHCIGFTCDQYLADELVKTLDGMGIEYFRDKIPYTAERYAHRIFVFGADICKTSHLKEKYYHPKHF